MGDKVVFTGFVGQDRQRARLEDRSRELGVRVLGSVSGLTAMLVTDGSFSGGKLERAHELGTRIVAPETYAALLKHLQPALAADPKVAPKAPAAQRNDPGVAAGSPAEIRAWGITNGYAVGVRGRLSAELKAAYEEATSLTGV